MLKPINEIVNKMRKRKLYKNKKIKRMKDVKTMRLERRKVELKNPKLKEVRSRD